MLNSQDLVRRHPDAFAGRLDDELVIMSTSSGQYHCLNSTGTDIWDLMSEPRQVRDLAADLTALYEVEAEECASAVNLFLEDLLGRGLLLVDRAP